MGYNEYETDLTATYNIQGDIVSVNDKSAPKTRFDQETSNKPRYGTLDMSNNSKGTELMGSGQNKKQVSSEPKKAISMKPRGISDPTELVYLNSLKEPSAKEYSHDLTYSERNKYLSLPLLPSSGTLKEYINEKNAEKQAIINLQTM